MKISYFQRLFVCDLVTYKYNVPDACSVDFQEKLFHVAGLPMVENCLSGYNSCVFAYGQVRS